MTNKRKRSPSYPYISMQKGVNYLSLFYQEHTNNFVPVDLAMKTMDLTPTSSTSNRIVSSMIDYGIIEDEGVKDQKRIRVTPLGMRLLKETRDDLIRNYRRQATLNEGMMKTAFEEWKNQLPSNVTMKSVLELDWDFTERAALRFIKVIRDNYQYAKLDTYNYLLDNNIDYEDELYESKETRKGKVYIKGQKDPRLEEASSELGEDLKDYRIPLEGGKRFVFIYIPSGITSTDANFIQKHVDLLMQQLVESDKNTK